MYNDENENINNIQQFNPAAEKNEAENKKRSGGRTAAKVVALALCCTVLGAAAGFGGGVLGSASQKKAGTATLFEGERETSVIQVSSVDTGTLMTAAELYAANVNSTVGITTSITTNFWGYQTRSAASGSGFILSGNGYILTNYHVIENSDSITVALYDGTSYDARLIGYDESNDIAVLKIDAEGLSPVILGDSDNMNVGDDVVAIGNPLGELTFSLTSGTISALNREITMSSGSTMDLIQTDCAINSGNSGGALFNMYGEVIGITNAKYSSSSSGASVDNIGFAIPVNNIRSIVESIIEKGYISKPYIGVSVTDVSQETQSYGLPQGAAVKAVTEDGPAYKAGLQVNDIITQTNGQTISGSSDLVQAVKAAAVGDELTLTVYRQGETLELTVTVAEQIQSALANEEEPKAEESSSQMLPWGFGFGG